MLFCDTGGADAAAHDTLVSFVAQLRAHRVPAVISERSLPEEMRPAQQYDVAPFLTSAAPTMKDHLVLLAAEKVSAERATLLRDMAAGGTLACTAYGAFETRQAEISVAARLAFALGVEPELITAPTHPGLPEAHLPIFGAPATPTARKVPTVGLFFPDLAQPEAQGAIRSLKLMAKCQVEIVTNGTEKKDWIAKDGYTTPAWHLGELLPRALADRFDLAVFCGAPVVWPRFQLLFANLAVRGVPLIDATPNQVWSQHIPEVIKGPSRLSDLGPWLGQDVMPQRARITAELQESGFVQALQLPENLAEFVPKPANRRSAGTSENTRVLFVPTNGVGLGHAKRCSLIADALPEKVKPTFAAFPSCIGMLTAAGYDTTPLVSRAGQRAPHDNDILNAGRLAAAAAGAAATVFDGGYVFDSVMRAAADNQLPSIWVRRGLWQASQNNEVARDRQKTFTRVIVPTEAFDELNGPAETNSNVRAVGPVVQHDPPTPNAAAKQRQALAKALKLGGEKLVVTMLGGGVAADRRAQINAVCAHLAGREDVMHLLVVWPTATTDPGWFHYPNTRVVQSIHASALIPLADLFVSAVGYNSFHEALYAGTPTIFIPQMAGFMDDQRARAKAAAERELALLIEPWELLSLTHAIDACLAGQAATLRENLRKQNLPPPGNAEAAAEIAEVIA